MVYFGCYTIEKSRFFGKFLPQKTTRDKSKTSSFSRTNPKENTGLIEFFPNLICPNIVQLHVHKHLSHPANPDQSALAASANSR